MIVLEVKNLGKTFSLEDRDGLGLEALRDINLEVSKGEFISIVGPSGCGKSTLFGIIGGLRKSSCGQVLIKGQQITGPHPAIGMVFQEESAFPWLTSLENAEFGLKMAGVGKTERRERAREMLDLVGLAGFEHHYPGELSGGMKQRVAIARTLVMEPEIILMDEPFGALDEQTRMILGEELLRICEKVKATILFITHSISESVMLSDRVFVMSGRPGRCKRIIDIDIAKPRTSSSIATRRFGEITEEIWSELKEETARAMKIRN